MCTQAHSSWQSVCRYVTCSLMTLVLILHDETCPTFRHEESANLYLGFYLDIIDVKPQQLLDRYVPGALVPFEGNLYTTAYKHILYDCVLLYNCVLVTTVWGKFTYGCDGIYFHSSTA